MRCWGELKSLRPQSVGEVSAYTNHECRFQDMWKLNAGLQLVEKLATPLVRLGLHRRSKILYPNNFLTLDPKSIRRDASFAWLDFQTVRAEGREVASKIEEFFSQPFVKIGP